MFQAGPVEILPFLYLGSAFHASKKDMLDGMGISALLNVSSNCPNHFEGVYQYKCIPVEDNHKEDISSWFIEAIEFIGKLNFLRRIHGIRPKLHPVVHYKGNRVPFGT
jgi:dual specificity MAP kinase phosphatase